MYRWKKIFGEKLIYIGIDFNDLCEQLDDPKNNIFVNIGSQANATFLNEVCMKYGKINI